MPRPSLASQRELAQLFTTHERATKFDQSPPSHIRRYALAGRNSPNGRMLSVSSSARLLCPIDPNMSPSGVWNKVRHEPGAVEEALGEHAAILTREIWPIDQNIESQKKMRPSCTGQTDKVTTWRVSQSMEGRILQRPPRT